MRKFLIAILLGASLGASAAHAAEGPYFIHKPEVNLRETPNGEIILVFNVNDKVFVVESDGNWSYVSAPGREARGWVWKEYFGEGRVGVQTVASQSEPNVPKPAIASSTPQAGLITDIVISQGDELVVADLLLSQPTEITASVPKKAETGFIADSPQVDSNPANQTEAPRMQFQPMLGNPQSSDADITIPATLGAGYTPVGGNDIALINGFNVNVRSNNTTGSQVLGNVNEGDKGYVIFGFAFFLRYQCSIASSNTTHCKKPLVLA